MRWGARRLWEAGGAEEAWGAGGAEEAGGENKRRKIFKLANSRFPNNKQQTTNNKQQIGNITKFEATLQLLTLIRFFTHLDLGKLRTQFSIGVLKRQLQIATPDNRKIVSKDKEQLVTW